MLRHRHNVLRLGLVDILPSQELVQREVLPLPRRHVRVLETQVPQKRRPLPLVRAPHPVLGLPAPGHVTQEQPPVLLRLRPGPQALPRRQRARKDAAAPLVAQRRGLDVLALGFAGFHVAVGGRELWFGMVCMIFYRNS